MGNLGDRLFRAPGLFRGRVVDWINLPHFPWTFNLADASVTCAAVLIAILALRGTRIDGTTPAHAATPDPDPAPGTPASGAGTPASGAGAPAKGLGGPPGTQEGTRGDTDPLASR
jgi:signal peptidase II